MVSGLKGYENQEGICFGYAILAKPDGELMEDELIEIYLDLKAQYFSKAKEIVDKSFSSAKSKMKIVLGIVGMELGFEIEDDRFPYDKYLPIVGFKFLTETNEGDENDSS